MKHFKANTCRIFLPRKYDVISQLRQSYAKGPFCVARLNYTFQKSLIILYCHMQTVDCFVNGVLSLTRLQSFCNRWFLWSFCSLTFHFFYFLCNSEFCQGTRSDLSLFLFRFPSIYFTSYPTMVSMRIIICKLLKVCQL